MNENGKSTGGADGSEGNKWTPEKGVGGAAALRCRLVSRLEATEKSYRRPVAHRGVACRPDHYQHCPLMDIYECTNQRYHYRASM